MAAFGQVVAVVDPGGRVSLDRLAEFVHAACRVAPAARGLSDAMDCAVAAGDLDAARDVAGVAAAALLQARGAADTADARAAALGLTPTEDVRLRRGAARAISAWRAVAWTGAAVAAGVCGWYIFNTREANT